MKNSDDAKPYDASLIFRLLSICSLAKPILARSIYAGSPLPPHVDVVTLDVWPSLPRLPAHGSKADSVFHRAVRRWLRNTRRQAAQYRTARAQHADLQA